MRADIARGRLGHDASARSKSDAATAGWVAWLAAWACGEGDRGEGGGGKAWGCTASTESAIGH